MMKAIKAVCVAVLLMAGCAAGDDSALFESGMKEVQAQNFEKAADFFKQAVDANPKNPQARFALAEVYTRLGKFDPAIEQCYAVVKQDQSNSQAFAVLGNIFTVKGDPTNAMMNYQVAISLNFKDFASHNNLGMLYMQSGVFDFAFEEFRDAIAANPEYAQAYYNIGLLYIEMRSNQQAIDSFEKFKPLWKGNKVLIEQANGFISNLKAEK